MADLRPTAHYFGCHIRAGHFLWAPGMASHIYYPPMFLDGELAPVSKEWYEQQFIVKFWRLHGVPPMPWSAFSFWDRTVDKRPGSNSIFYVPGHTVSQEDMVAVTRRLFPEVWARLPELTLLDGFDDYTPRNK